MKDLLKKKVAAVKDPGQKLNNLREGLQHLILKILDDSGYFKMLSFVGGTSLRVVYDLRRFSEDVDFSLQTPDDPRFKFSNMLEDLKKYLAIYHFSIDTKTKQVGAVQNCFLRFKDILYELGISPLKSEKLSIKLEVDTHPPAQARFQSHLIQKDFLFTLVHHDPSTLCAGKMLAFLFRSYTKGRDMYDLVWFLTKKTTVNKNFFENGLYQATGNKLSWSRDDLKRELLNRLESLDIQTARKDAQPFLEDSAELRFFDKTLILPLIENVDFDEL